MPEGAGEQPPWRISVATIDHDAPFSEFANTDRLLMPLTRDGLTLNIHGTIELVPAYSVLSFDGQAKIAAVQIKRSGRDLNVIIARKYGRATLVHMEVLGQRGVTAGESEIVVIFDIFGGLCCGNLVLKQDDAALLEPGEAIVIKGKGRVAVVRIRPNTIVTSRS